MLRVTLDTNCVIDVEEERPNAEHVRRLAGYAESGQVQLCIPSIMASERSPGGNIAQSFEAFQEKLQGLGLAGADLLAPLPYWEIVFWDNCLWGDVDEQELEPRIHEVLFPEVPFSWVDFCKANGLPESSPVEKTRWLNAKCDVLALWSHIFHASDVFVTSDGNFHKATKMPKLVELGAGQILRPQEAVKHVGAVATAI